MSKEKGTPNKTHEDVMFSNGVVPHEQFPNELIREQRLSEGRMYLDHEVAEVEMKFIKSQNVVGSNMASARERAGYTQQQIADALGVSEKTIRNYESGRRVPDVLQLRLMCVIFGVSSDRLLGLVGEDVDRLFGLYDFSTPAQREVMLERAGMIQSGTEDHAAEWATADELEWRNDTERRAKRMLTKLIDQWGTDEVAMWLSASDERKERLKCLLRND